MEAKTLTLVERLKDMNARIDFSVDDALTVSSASTPPSLFSTRRAMGSDWVAVRRATLEEWARMIEVEGTPGQAGPTADDIHALVVDPSAPDVPPAAPSATGDREPVQALCEECGKVLQCLVCAAPVMTGDSQAAGNIADMLDTLLMQCVLGPSPAWVMLPRSEYENVQRLFRASQQNEGE